MLDSVTDIVRRASELMLTDVFSINEKDGCANIVTSSDLAVQDFLCRELRKLIPESGFFCEEEEFHDPDKEYVWVIDPIDGTANYSRGIDHCCISVALEHFGEIILGVVFSPARNEIYTAEKGKGAFCNGKPIHVSERSFGNSLFCTAMSTYRKEYAGICNEVIMDTYRQCNDFRRFGSAAIELCFLARGFIELYFEFRLQPWDYAAAMLILTEAGGYIRNLDGSLPRLNSPDLVFAANSEDSINRLSGIVRGHISTIPYSD